MLWDKNSCTELEKIFFCHSIWWPQFNCFVSPPLILCLATLELRTWFDFDNTSEIFFFFFFLGGGGISCMPQTRKCSAATYLFLLHMHLHHWTWGILLPVGLGPDRALLRRFYALIWKYSFTLVTAILLLLLLGPDTSGLIGTACIGMKPSLLRISDTLFPW